jgi:Protein kinase domain
MASYPQLDENPKRNQGAAEPQSLVHCSPHDIFRFPPFPLLFIPQIRMMRSISTIACIMLTLQHPSSVLAVNWPTFTSRSSGSFPSIASSSQTQDITQPRFIIHTDKILGKGNYGTVFAAIDTFNNDQLVAVKRIPFDASTQAIRSDEWKVQCSLSHPHILGCIEQFQDNGYSYIVTEYLPNGDLGHYCFSKPEVHVAVFCHRLDCPPCNTCL